MQQRSPRMALLLAADLRSDARQAAARDRLHGTAATGVGAERVRVPRRTFLDRFHRRAADAAPTPQTALTATR